MAIDGAPGARRERALPLGARFRVVHAVNGRLRLKLDPPRSRARLEAGRTALAAVSGVREVRSSASAWSLIVEYDPAGLTPAALLHLPLAETAMPAADAFPESVEAVAVVAASPERVWHVLSDPEQLMRHTPTAARVWGTPDADHWTAEIEILGERMTERVDIIERVPDRRLVLALTDGPVRARITLTLEADVAQTRLRERLDYALPGNFLERLASKVAVGPQLRAQLHAHLDRIGATAAEAPGQHAVG